MRKQKYDVYGNEKEYLEKYEFKEILFLKKKYAKQLNEIKLSDKCYGDKVREVLKKGITDNTVFARKLIEII